MSDYGGYSGDQWGHQPPPPGYQQAPGYPSGGYQQPYGAPPSPPAHRSRGGGCLKALGIGTAGFIGLVVLLVIVAIATASDDEEPAGEEPATAGEQPAAEAPEGSQEVYAIGQTAHSGDLDITVHAVQDPYQPTNEFETPQPGHRFVGVEAELGNSTGELITWSSILGAELTDSQGRPWDMALAGTDLPTLDGDVPIGGIRRGWVVFEVAGDATGLQVRIKGNPTATGSLFRLA